MEQALRASPSMWLSGMDGASHDCTLRGLSSWKTTWQRPLRPTGHGETPYRRLAGNVWGIVLNGAE
eukprot:14052640-Alexandrium_andersonii.AAC.1